MFRLRDLTRRQALVGVAMVLLVVAPFASSVLRARSMHWVPSGDDALIGLRSWDVATSHRPLIGQGSTTHLYGQEGGTSHPGPIQFYWLAVPMRLLGPAAGMILGSAAVNLTAVLVAAWVVLRRAGPAVAAWAMVLLSLLLWSEGTAILSDPISSNAGAIPLVALAVLAWAVVDGDIRLLPLGALFGSWVAQQHLAIVVPAAAMVLAAVVGVIVLAVRRRRPSAGDLDPPRLWPWVTGAAALGLVLWSPVIWQQLTGDPGNLTAVAEYARLSDSPSLGWTAAFRQAIRTTGFPPLLARSDLTGRSFSVGPLTPLELIVGLAGYGVLVATVVVAWTRRRTLALLALIALLLAAAGTCNGSTIPNSIEAYRINFYRWEFVAAWLLWLTFGWVGALAVRSLLARRGRPVPAALPRFAPALAVVVMLVPTIGNLTTEGYNDARRDRDGFVAMRAMSDAAIDAAEEAGADRVTLVLRGKAAVLSTGQAMALQLEAAGYDVVVPEQEDRFWGDQRVLEKDEDPGDLILLLATGRGVAPEGLSGRTIARYDINDDLRSVLTPLVDQARSADPVPGADADRLLAERYDPMSRVYAKGLLDDIAFAPEPILTDAKLLQLIEDGYYESPTFDGDQIDELQRLLPAPTVNEDDVLELRVLTRAELADAIPSWKE
ncbi:MAG: hypothetical protein JWO77_600 [Ilumatobacteraceae bacterium]|nr:hypothetical protein [Ilumatobacteraceae bacterium]